MHIHVEWDGPLSYSDVTKLHTDIDYGVYQIYGAHPIYGAKVLVYIGKADMQTFGTRLSQESWQEVNQDPKNIEVYVGRLSGYDGTPNEEKWSKAIADVESLLIYSHWPAGNSSGLNKYFSKELHDVHVLNWGRYKSLLPEVSGARYSDLYESDINYKPYELGS